MCLCVNETIDISISDRSHIMQNDKQPVRQLSLEELENVNGGQSSMPRSVVRNLQEKKDLDLTKKVSAPKLKEGDVIECIPVLQ